jgi:hypothetical protein
VRAVWFRLGRSRVDLNRVGEMGYLRFHEDFLSLYLTLLKGND